MSSQQQNAPVLNHPKILVDGDPRLLQPSPVTDDRALLRRVVDEMIPLFDELHGVGLAAPQLGHNVRVLLAKAIPNRQYPDVTNVSPLYVMINPVIESESAETVLKWESCFSVPGAVGQVRRPASITVSWLDENFTPQRQTFTSFLARIIQHEMDHLNGEIFTDKLEPGSTRMTFEEYIAMRNAVQPVQP